MPQLATVAVGRPVRGAFTYLIPEELAGKLRLGQRLLVPFGKTKALAFYLGPAEAAPAKGVLVRSIERELEADPALPPDLIALLRFAAEHYHYPLGETIRNALPPGLSEATEPSPPGPEVEYVARALPGAEVKSLARAPAQAAALSYLLAVGGCASLAEVAHAIPGAR
jgi:primosomal protein N' (replication factor Y)